MTTFPSGAKAACLSLATLLLLGHCVTSLIIPEELPTILSLIYSNIPPIKKGTDSRLGIGFRLGEHADFQVIVELGPQKETDPIGSDAETKRKRATMMTAAMKGELGPWAQAVAKYQLEQKVKKALEKYKLSTEKTKPKYNSSKSTEDNKSEGNDWLSKWSQGLAVDSEDPPAVEQVPAKKILPNVNRMRVVNSQQNRESENSNAQRDLEILKKLFGNENETKTAK